MTEQISPRLKNALVSYLVADNVDRENDHWLTERLDDESDWTWHLGEQLGFRARYGTISGLHDTLLFIVRILDDWIREPWPPAFDMAFCEDVARGATQDLTPFELYSTLLAGPQKWMARRVNASCTLGELPKRIQPVLERALAADLNQMLDRWVTWKIPDLAQRRREAIKAQREGLELKEEPPGPPKPRVPPNRQALADSRALRQADYTPPGRTY